MFAVCALLLCGLTASFNARAAEDAEQVYRVLNLVFSWDTGPKKAIYLNQTSLSFLVLGDWGMGNVAQQQVADAMSEFAAHTHVDLIMTTGDNFYPDGVQSVVDPLWKSYFEDVYLTSSLRGIPWYVVLGNHDYLGDINAQIDYGAAHPDWRMPDRYHEVTINIKNGVSVQMLFLDTNIAIDTYRARPDIFHHIDEVEWGDEVTWLRNRLAASKAKWRLVYGHHPVYSSGTTHGNTSELFSSLLPLFDGYRVNAYFAGHEHDLEHYKPPGLTNYYISGGGSGHRSVSPKPESLFAGATAGFEYFRIDGDCMHVQFIDNLGNVIYQAVQPVSTGVSCPAP